MKTQVAKMYVRFNWRSLFTGDLTFLSPVNRLLQKT